MRRETGNPCFDCRCGWYDSDLGCTCPSLEKWYQCPLEPEPDWEEIMKEEKKTMGETCATCTHFIGSGDWGLCCDLKYDLCYSCTPKCNEYEERKEVQKSE